MADLQLFDALPPHIEAALRESIVKFGVLVPVAKDQHGRILDGHHRSRLADELGVRYRVDVIVVEDDVHAAEIARTLNSDRRQLSEEQRREVAAVLRSEGHSLRAIAAAVGVSAKTIHQDLAGVTQVTPASVVGTDGKRYPARRPTIVTGKNEREAARIIDALAGIDQLPASPVIDTKRAERIAREQAAERRRQEPTALTTVDDLIEIRHGDMACLADLAGTVDAIITDPPYESAYWDDTDSVYDRLGALAAKLLKPDGILAVMTGTRADLVDAVDQQIREWMRRRHRAVYLVPGQRWRDNQARVATGYKPILIYSRLDADPASLRWILDDVFTSDATRQDDGHHRWGQTESGMASIVERLSEPGALVVDPFIGGGTTAVVCKSLGRRFVGTDIDPAAVDTTRTRLGHDG